MALINLKETREEYKKDSIQKDKIDTSLIIPFKEYQIEFILENDNFNIIEKNRIDKDTLLIVGPDINELKAIRISGLDSNDFKIYQMYNSKLILEFDGKAFELNNWKEYSSEWFQNPNVNNVKKYSEEDYTKFPNYNRNELLDALEINKESISEYWYDFVIENLDKKNSEIFFEPIIYKTTFRIEITGKEDVFIKLEHMIGC